MLLTVCAVNRYTLKSKMWYNILFLFGLLIIQTNAVNMCTNGSAASTVSTGVTLNLLNGSGVSGCNCSVKLQNADQLGSIKSRIEFEAVQFSGCKYKLVISYKKTNNGFSCDNTSPFYHDINKRDEIKLYLKRNVSSEDDTKFEVKITSDVTAIENPLLRLDCFSPYSNQTTATSTATTPVSPTTVPPTYKSTVGTSKQSDKDLEKGIIGGAVGGGVLLVIVLIITFVCIIWRKKKRRDYDRPVVRESNTGYTDIVGQGKDNNSSREMEIIENDLYISSGDVMQSKSRDNDDTNQKPDNVYAVVKKDRKPTNTASKDDGHSKFSIDPENDRKFVVGPRGDEYTLVERK